MRIARDSLMESIYPVTSAYHVEGLDAGGVPSELVCSKATLAAHQAADAPKLIVLVHGGMFVTGSPRAGRHLAAKLSDLCGLPVVTPTLRLAPEHQYPAALDDLRAAYAALAAMPVGGAKVVEVTARSDAIALRRSRTPVTGHSTSHHETGRIRTPSALRAMATPSSGSLEPR